MTDKFNIMVVDTASGLDTKFYIDVPVHTMMEGEKALRMQIPQELAKYMNKLQTENMKLKRELEEMRRYM